MKSCRIWTFTRSGATSHYQKIKRYIRRFHVKQICIRFCGCLDPPQIYIGATGAIYAPSEPHLSNYLLIYSYPDQFNPHADLQQESATNLFAHRSYRQICSQSVYTQIFNKNLQLIMLLIDLSFKFINNLLTHWSSTWIRNCSSHS